MREPDAELFDRAPALQSIPLPEADVVLLRSLDLGREPSEIMQELIASTPWRDETVTLWGKEYRQPRLVAWYGDGGSSYTYSGRRFDPLPWTGLLSDLRARVEVAARLRFNSVLLNFYRDHRDSVAMHSDDERELGPTPAIASLSLGETRTFVLKHKHDRTQRSWKLPLPSGSLLLMQGPTQRNWQHGVPKLSQPCGPRVNLTFRQILTGSP